MSSSKYIHRQEPITQWAPDIVYNTSIKTIRILRFCVSIFLKIILVILLSPILKNLVLLKNSLRVGDFIFPRRLSTENCWENKECRRMCNWRKPFLLRRGATYLLLIEFERKKTRMSWQRRIQKILIGGGEVKTLTQEITETFLGTSATPSLFQTSQHVE